jgi:tRNA (cmo5U34)-methyltransferase
MSDMKSAAGLPEPEAYERSIRQTIPFYDLMHAQTIDLVRTVKPNVEMWLDTGCGTGYTVELALPLFPRARFTLADPDEAMLSFAKTRLKDVAGNRVRFLPPMPTAGLLAHRESLHPQVITAIQCHHYLQPHERREATRVCFELLDPGGLYVTFENIEPRIPQGTQIALERWKRFQVESGRSPESVQDHAKRFKTKYFPIPVEEHLRLLDDAGFSVVELFWYSQMQAGFYAVK